MEGLLQALARAAGQQGLCRPWEGLQSSKGSAGPGKGCRAARVSRLSKGCRAARVCRLSLM